MSDVFESLWAASLSQRGTLRIWTGDAAVKLVGTEHGVLTIVEMQRVPNLGVVLLLHEEGRKYWAARGLQKYAGASSRAVLLESGAGPSFRYVELCSSDDPKNWVERAQRSARLSEMLMSGWAVSQSADS